MPWSLIFAYLISSRDGGRVVAAAMFGAGCGIYLFFRGFRILQRKRLIENTPTSKIRAAAMGLVEVNGLATGPHTIPAPITGLPCYYYRSIAWQIKKSGNSEHLEKVADESLHVPFYIDDNTGRVLVDPQGAEMDIHRDFCETYSNSLFSGSLGVPANVGGFLARHNIDCDRKTRIEEFCIKPKNALFILGTLTPNHGITVSAAPVRSLMTNGTVSHPAVDAVSTPLSDSQQQKVASALLKAGISNPAAWAIAGVPDLIPSSVARWAGGSAAAAKPALEPFDLSPTSILMKGTHDPVFYISWHSQRDVVRSLGWKSALMIWGGPLLTFLSTYVIGAYFGWL